MTDIYWDDHNSVMTVAAERSLGNVLDRIARENPYWVVVIRRIHGTTEVYYYAYMYYELVKLAGDYPERLSWSIEQAIEMHEWKSSTVTHGKRFSGDEPADNGPATSRLVNLNAVGSVDAIGEFEGPLPAMAEPEELTKGNGGPYRDELAVDEPVGATEDESWDFETTDLGPMRGSEAKPPPREPYPEATIFEESSGAEDEIGSTPQPTKPKKDIEITLSAETKNEINIGANEVVDFRIELTSEAVPLAVSQVASAKPDVPIKVSLSVENDIIEIVRDREYSVDPPVPGQPRTGFFLVKGIRTGVSRLAVIFLQGGSELGVIGLVLSVVEAGAGAESNRDTAIAVPRDIADDEKLLVYIESREENNQMCFHYYLHYEKLGQTHHIQSSPLLDRGNGPAASTIAFVERIYDRVTQKIKSHDDLNQLQRETRALGALLCQELFDPRVTEILWPLRDKIKLIHVYSWEPYIPWELVRLHDPESGEIDDRFLAEYGLIRSLSGTAQPRELSMSNWGYLGATFTRFPYPPIGAELDYFTTTSQDSLQGHGIMPTAIDPTRDAFYDAISGGDYDVLHISCHAESHHESIEDAILIIGDEIPQGSVEPRLIEVDTVTVQAEAKLKQHKPIVFLNGCETGRFGAVLTAWGGWPNVFIRAGAGVFVGSSWAVRDKPAASFSTAFYNALLDGKTLVEAASEARAAAKTRGDSSWLAFKVYGHPFAHYAPV